MNKSSAILLIFLIVIGNFSFAQQTAIRYKDFPKAHRRPLDINDDMFIISNPSIIYFEDTQTCNYLYRIFERMRQDSESVDTIFRAPNVCRQITVEHPYLPSYRLSYDPYHMALNGVPLQFNNFLYQLIERIIELNGKDTASYIRESIIDYHSGGRHPMIETLLQEQIEEKILIEPLKVDIGLGHPVHGRIEVAVTGKYGSIQSEMPKITAWQIANMDTCWGNAATMCHYYRVYPMYSGPLVMKSTYYIYELADKYPLPIISSNFSQKENDHIVTLSPPSLVITPSTLSVILEQLEEIITPTAIDIPSDTEITLPIPDIFEYHLFLPCQFY